MKLLAVSLLALAAAAGVSAANAQGERHPDFSGFWEQKLVEARPLSHRQTLTPAADAAEKAAAAATAARMARGQLFDPKQPSCTYRGLSASIFDSSPTNIIQTDKEILFLWETNAAPRHVYMDGRPWPDPKALKLTTNGFSLGHFEGDNLVIETRGFAPTSIWGGGHATPQTRLIENYRMIEGGKRLLMTFTWIDPTILSEPRPYTFVYDRDPPETYASTLFCDASDPAQRANPTSPPQDP